MAQKKETKTSAKKTSIKTIKEVKPNHKLVVYQATAHLWGNKLSTNKVYGSISENGTGKMADFDDTALKALKDFGYTHIWIMGLLENATLVDNTKYGIPKDHPAVVKGIAGSPFAVKDYYDINPNIAIDPKNRMAEFDQLVQRIHNHGLKLIMDFIPNHVARQYHSDAKPSNVSDFGDNDDNSVIFSAKNNFYYLPGQEFIVPEGVKPAVPQETFYEEKPAKVTGNDVFKAMPNINDWFETIKLNYGVNILNNGSKHFDPIPDTWLKMTDILKYWTAKGVDGFRCDMAEMVPVEFWNYAITASKSVNKDLIFIAEIYRPNEYEAYTKIGKFDYLYDKVGLYDALRRLIENKPEATTADITKVWQNESGNFPEKMLRFLENHDEQRIASDFFAKNPTLAIPAMLLSATLHGGPIMIFFGQELGEPSMDAEGFGSKDGRTTMFDFWGVKSHQAWMNGGKFDGALLNKDQLVLQKAYKEIINFSKTNIAITDGAFYDLQYANNYAGANKSKLYSYLRYTGTQKLLFMFNFDLEHAQTFQIIIPSHAISLANISKPSIGQEIGLNGIKSTKNTDLSKPITLAKNSFKVIEIK